MSLDYDLRGIPEDVRTSIADYDDKFSGISKGDRILNPVTNTLIWSTMIVGIGIIDDKTIDEFASRIDVYQRLYGPLMSTWNGDTATPRPITREDIEAHRSLSTNVFPMETRTSWIKRMVNTRDLFPSSEPKKSR